MRHTTLFRDFVVDRLQMPAVAARVAAVVIDPTWIVHPRPGTLGLRR
ncbi:MAG: hypothetical protein JO180_07615 [Gemmatirosa sp.]|nr:hypothetical protein [Gemmatirosa sp.]